MYTTVVDFADANLRFQSLTQWYILSRAGYSITSASAGMSTCAYIIASSANTSLFYYFCLGMFVIIMLNRMGLMNEIPRC